MDSQKQLADLIAWIREYSIRDYVLAQDYQDLTGVDKSRIWSEYFSYDDDCSYAFNFYLGGDTDDETLLGFYIGEKNHTGEVAEVSIQTEAAIPCPEADCWDGDPCKTCGGTRVVGQINLYEIAVDLISKQAHAEIPNRDEKTGQQSRFCFECGEQLRDGAKFCSGCGTSQQ
jgi:hypothetical protein